MELLYYPLVLLLNPFHRLSVRFHSFFHFLLSSSSLSLLPGVFFFHSPDCLSHFFLPLSSPYLREYSTVCIYVSMCVCGSGAALLAGGGGERERKSSERGKDMHTQRSKAFTGTKHAVSISQIRAAYSPLILSQSILLLIFTIYTIPDY